MLVRMTLSQRDLGIRSSELRLAAKAELRLTDQGEVLMMALPLPAVAGWTEERRAELAAGLAAELQERAIQLVIEAEYPSSPS